MHILITFSNIELVSLIFLQKYKTSRKNNLFIVFNFEKKKIVKLLIAW